MVSNKVQVRTDHNIKVTTPNSDLYQIILEDLVIMKPSTPEMLTINLMEDITANELFGFEVKCLSE
jgi:hypothetical protein